MKSKKLLQKVATREFAFPESRDGLALLRSIHEGTYANTKPGDASFHAYAAAVNVTSEFAAQALDIVELIPFNNKLADIQEDYMPSYPPMSPVTIAFFSGWMVLDAKDHHSELTLGGMFAHYLKTRNELECLQHALSFLNDSYCAFYEVLQAEAGEVRLWDIAVRREFRCWNSSGYAGRRGEVWFARVLPPFSAYSHLWVTVSTPYVFAEGGRAWEGFIARCLGPANGSDNRLQEYLKHGKFLGYWLEFIHQAYANYTWNAIFLAGFPDQPESRPHSDERRKL